MLGAIFASCAIIVDVEVPSAGTGLDVVITVTSPGNEQPGPAFVQRLCPFV